MAYLRLLELVYLTVELPAWSVNLSSRMTKRPKVDLVLEAPDGRVVAIEVKASGQLGSTATRGLVHLRNRLGDRFVVGLVLNTGDQAQRIGDRLAVAPLEALWRSDRR